MQKVVCPYCGRVAKYVDSSVIYYGHSYGIGYEISDMEKSLLDGTHPSYESAEEES